jgi:hypothetical protein
MSVEIHQPEIEALIEQRMASGAFQDVEEVLIHALKSAPALPAVPSKDRTLGKVLVDEFAKAREILAGVELDFTRDPSPGRPVNPSEL